DAVVDETQAAVAGARIVEARFEIVVRQFDQRIVLAQSHGLRRGCDAGDRSRKQAAAESAATTAEAAAAGSGCRSARGGDLYGRRSLGRPCAETAAAPAGGLVGEGQRHFDLGVL